MKRRHTHNTTFDESKFYETEKYTTITPEEIYDKYRRINKKVATTTHQLLVATFCFFVSTNAIFVVHFHSAVEYNIYMYIYIERADLNT